MTTSEEKELKIARHFEEILKTLGLDITDDSLKETPQRIAKMYVRELFWGLDRSKKPSVSLFKNVSGYSEMLLEKNINIQSTCEHHFLPIIGKAHIAYLPGDKIIGLSKINRIADYCARKPQVQERLTVEICTELKTALGTENVACLIEADHMCVRSRGIRDFESQTTTVELCGKFKDSASLRSEFFRATTS